jgi:hypothetical protein
MENEYFILRNNPEYDRILEYMGKSPEEQRFAFFKKRINKTVLQTKKETDTHIYWSAQTKTPRFENNKLFYTSHTVDGATYDKKARSLKLWFGQTFVKLDPVIQENIMNHFGFDWYEQASFSLKSIMNASLLNRIIKGNITNPRDFVKAYIKTSPFRNIDVSPEIFYKAFQSLHYESPKFFRRMMEHSTNPEKTLDVIVHAGFWGLSRDLYEQAMILNKKVNPSWSEKRVKEVHDEWTREIMYLSIKSLELHDYNYSSITLPERLSFIENNIKLFEEGSIMKHCIYTNYEARIMNKKYFGLKYSHGDIRATVGLIVVYSTTGKQEVVLDQMYGIGNSQIPEEHKDYVKSWLEQDETQKWFSKETQKVQVTQGVTQVYQDPDLAWL